MCISLGPAICVGRGRGALLEAGAGIASTAPNHAMPLPLTDNFFIQSVNKRGYSFVRLGQNEMIFPADPVSITFPDEIIIDPFVSH